MTETMQSLAQQLTTLARQAEQAVNVDINDIIRRGDRDEARIERQFDHMLGFCYDPDMLQAYKKLCRYYFTLNPQATADYVYAYRDMWDSEDAVVPGGGV